MRTKTPEVSARGPKIVATKAAKGKKGRKLTPSQRAAAAAYLARQGVSNAPIPY